MNAQTLLEARRVGLAYGLRTVVSGVSLVVNRGSVVGLVGPNGSGKSSALRALAGLHAAREGSVDLLGRAIAAYSPRALAGHRAFVPDGLPLELPYTVSDILGLARAHRQPGFAPCTETIDEGMSTLARMGLDVAPDRVVSTLSRGERHLVMLAQALLQGADLQCWDEPFANLDLDHQAKVVAELRRTLARGGAAVIATHHLTLAAMVCDELLLLGHGTVAAQGKPEEVLEETSLRRVYGPSVRVRRLPPSGSPVVLPLFD